MRLIFSIIKKLKKGEDIDPAHRKVVGELLDEMMLRDEANGDLYVVKMSKEMYMRINTTFYTPEGLFKFKTFKP